MWGKTVRGRGRGRGVCEIPVRLPMNDGAMETGIHVDRYSVHARLDYWIM